MTDEMAPRHHQRRCATVVPTLDTSMRPTTREGPRRRPRIFSIVATVVVLGVVPRGVSSAAAAIVGHRRPLSRGRFGGRRLGGPRLSPSPLSSSSLVIPALGVRGGEIDEGNKRKKATTRKRSGSTGGGGEKKKGGAGGKKKKKKRGDEEGTTKGDEDGGETKKEGRGDDGKRAIDEAMRGTDAAQALGDAIRERRDILLSDPPDGEGGEGDAAPPVITVVDSSLASLGLSLGTSSDATTDIPRTGGGVSETTTATERTVADYFLRGGHGGAYAAQSAASALAVGCGAGCLAMLVAHKKSESPSPLPLILLRRCLLAAMAKHASGLFAAALVSARAIPTDGLRRTRARLEGLVLDPVAQYLCYSALLLVWTGTGGAVPIAGGKEGEGATPWPWWMGRWYLVSCILGPILLREVVHVAWVLSDVAVISAGGEGNFVVSAATGVVDVVMSLLSGADRWRGTDAAGRQRILAKLVGRISLAMELVTGLIILLDALRALANYSLAPPDSTSRPRLTSVLTRLLCARLYVNFLLVRRRKIRRLITDIRGGASAAPVAILDVLLEPRKAMGLSHSTTTSSSVVVSSTTAGDGIGGEDEKGARKERGWIGLAAEGLGF